MGRAAALLVGRRGAGGPSGIPPLVADVVPRSRAADRVGPHDVARRGSSDSGPGETPAAARAGGDEATQPPRGRRRAGAALLPQEQHRSSFDCDASLTVRQGLPSPASWNRGVCRRMEAAATSFRVQKFLELSCCPSSVLLLSSISHTISHTIPLVFLAWPLGCVVGSPWPADPPVTCAPSRGPTQQNDHSLLISSEKQRTSRCGDFVADSCRSQGTQAVRLIGAEGPP